jgi:hypothetical protein
VAPGRAQPARGGAEAQGEEGEETGRGERDDLLVEEFFFFFSSALPVFDGDAS